MTRKIHKAPIAVTTAGALVAAPESAAPTNACPMDEGTRGRLRGQVPNAHYRDRWSSTPGDHQAPTSSAIHRMRSKGP